MTTSQHTRSRGVQLPWGMTAAALVAFAALSVSGGPGPILPLLAVGLLATYVVGARIEPAEWWVHWVLRLALYTTIALLCANKSNEELVDSIFSATVMDTVGQWAAAELVIQAWRRHPSAQAQLGPMILLSGLTLVAACQTSDDHYPRLFVPASLFLLLLSLGGKRSSRTAGRGIAITVALAAGMLTYGGVWKYRATLTDWSAKYLEGRATSEEVELSTQPMLGGTFGLRGSPRRVLRITGLIGITYLRDMAFDTYTRGRWGPEVDRRTYAPTPPMPGGAGARAHVFPMAEAAGMLFFPLNCRGIALRGNTGVEWASEVGGPLLEREAPLEPYDILQSTDAEHQGPLATPPTPAERRRCLAVPDSLDPRIRSLARRIAGTEMSPRRRITKVVTYLISHHRYSLTFHPGPGDPIVTFLLATPPPAAHCKYFASAATLLLRCLGVPARYVIGYYAHERDGPDLTVVRQRDAHAWVEAWVDGTGWVTVDATPGDGRPEEGVNSISLWQRLREWVADQGTDMRLRLVGLNWPRAAAWFTGAAVLLLALRAGWHSRLRRRDPAGSRTGYSTADASLAALAGRFEAALAHRGSPCPPGRPWQEHLSALGQGDTRAAVFVRAYSRARFGAPTPEERAHLATLLAEAERQLRQMKDQG